MPCYTVIRRRTGTMLKDGERLIAALRSLGYEVETYNENKWVTGVKRGVGDIQFRKEGERYTVSALNAEVAEVSRKYAELGVREWARRKGYSVSVGGRVEEESPRMLTIMNRRG